MRGLLSFSSLQHVLAEQYILLQLAAAVEPLVEAAVTGSAQLRKLKRHFALRALVCQCDGGRLRQTHNFAGLALVAFLSFALFLQERRGEQS